MAGLRRAQAAETPLGKGRREFNHRICPGWLRLAPSDRASHRIATFVALKSVRYLLCGPAEMNDQSANATLPT